MEGCIDTRKRVRDESSDSFFNFIGSKVVRVESPHLDFVSPDVNDTTPLDSHIKLLVSEQSGIHAIQEDLLKILDDADASIDRDSAIQGLDSVIRSFEDEIQVPDALGSASEPVLESAVSQPELGYLLEASDDELGLPPAVSPAEKMEEIEGVSFGAQYSVANGMKEFLGFEDEVASYCWLDNLSNENESYGGDEVVALGGLFDHSDGMAELPYRPETMSCL